MDPEVSQLVEEPVQLGLVGERPRQRGLARPRVEPKVPERGGEVFAEPPAHHDPVAHTYSYVPDIAAGLATLGTDTRTIGQAWHLPGPPTVTTRALLDLVAGEVGHPVGVRAVPRLALRALGLASPLMRGLAEMA